MLQRGPFLLVTGDDALAEVLNAPLQCYGVVRRARSSAEAIAMLPSVPRWCGVVFDLDRLGAAPLEVMRELRQADPLVSVLALASKVDSPLVNALHLHRAQLVLKPFAEANVLSFVQRALASGWLPDESVDAWVEELARRNNLTPQDMELVAYAMGNESHLNVQRRLGLSDSSLKAQVRSLLRKCNARSVDSLAKVVMRGAMVFGLGHGIYTADLFDENENAELEVTA